MSRSAAAPADVWASFLAARLDEEETEAKNRRGIFPSPGVEDNGAVWLHIKRGGNAVVVHYDHPAAGYGDMADLRAWADSEHGWTQDRVLREISAKRHRLAFYEGAVAEAERFPHGASAAIRDAFLTAVQTDAAVYADHPDYPGKNSLEEQTR